MKEDKTSSETTSRREFTKAAVIAAIAAPIAAFVASCTKRPRQAGEPTPSASPAPTPPPLDGDGSPITVGGGGNLKATTEEANVSCVFMQDADHYPEEPGSSGSHKNFKNKKGWKIKTFKIRSGGKWTDYSDQLPSNGACSIVIQCKGDDTEVTVDGDAFGLGFDTKTYVKVSDGYYRNPEAADYIQRVTLTVSGQVKVDKFFSEADKAKVCTDFVKPDKSHCPS